MILLILIFTIGGFTLFLLIAGLALIDSRPSQSKNLLVLFCISNAMGFLMVLPTDWGGSHTLRLTARFFDLPSVGLMWWLAQSLLDDKFRLNRFAWTGLLITLIPAIIFWLEDMGYNALVFPGSVWMNPIIFSLIVLHISWIAIAGLQDDVIHLRREVRLWIVALIVVTFSMNVIVGYVFDGNLKFLLKMGVVFCSLLLVFFWVVRLQTHILDFKELTPAILTQPTVDPKDHAAYQRLVQMMNIQKAYLESDLSVASLAERINIPPHQLRTLINRGLGYRNFSAFLASYRLDDIKKQLADPEKARTPILTIAMNGGFSSLATFNRTFKAELGQTAGEFRHRALSNNAQS